MPPLHTDQVNLNAEVGRNILLAGELGLLTDGNVTGATNVADLKAAIDANVRTKHSDQRGYAFGLKRALDLGKDDGTLTDVAVAAATGVSNLASLTLARGKVGPMIE